MRNFTRGLFALGLGAAALLGACGDSDQPVATGDTTTTELPTATEANTAESFTITDLTGEFDLELLVGGCDEDLKTCEGPGSVSVLAKTTKSVTQTIELDNVFADITNGQPEVARDGLYGEHVPTFIVVDIDFDDDEDLAIRTGNEGAYGAPSYDTYLLDDGKFVLSPEFTEVTHEGLDFPTVDPKDKTIHVLNKSGCCEHSDTTYTVSDDKPVKGRVVTEKADPDTGETSTTIDAGMDDAEH